MTDAFDEVSKLGDDALALARKLNVAESLLAKILTGDETGWVSGDQSQKDGPGYLCLDLTIDNLTAAEYDLVDKIVNPDMSVQRPIAPIPRFSGDGVYVYANVSEVSR